MGKSEFALGIFDSTFKAIELYREGKKQKDEKTDTALFALYTALNETKSYIESLNNGEKHKRKKEYALARLWHNASIPLRKIDPDLAKRCFLKGSYWMEPNTWSENMIKRNKIKLDQVMKSIKTLLLSK